MPQGSSQIGRDLSFAGEFSSDRPRRNLHARTPYRPRRCPPVACCG